MDCAEKFKASADMWKSIAKGHLPFLKKLEAERDRLLVELEEAQDKYRTLAKYMCLIKNATNENGEKIGDIVVVSIPRSLLSHVD